MQRMQHVLTRITNRPEKLLRTSRRLIPATNCKQTKTCTIAFIILNYFYVFRYTTLANISQLNFVYNRKLFLIALASNLHVNFSDISHTDIVPEHYNEAQMDQTHTAGSLLY